MLPEMAKFEAQVDHFVCLFLVIFNWFPITCELFSICYSVVSQYGQRKLAHSHMIHATFMRWENQNMKCFSDPFPIPAVSQWISVQCVSPHHSTAHDCHPKALNHPAFLHFYGNTAACQTPCPALYHRRLSIRARRLRQLGLCTKWYAWCRISPSITRS